MDDTDQRGPGRGTIQRMDNIAIVVDDLAAAKAFFVELGLELEGEATLEGSVVDRLVGLEGVRSDIAMMRTPDGHGRLELTKYHTPSSRDGDPRAPANRLGARRIMSPSRTCANTGQAGPPVSDRLYLSRRDRGGLRARGAGGAALLSVRPRRQFQVLAVDGEGERIGQLLAE